MKRYAIDDEVEYFAADVDPDLYVPSSGPIVSRVIHVQDDDTVRAETIQWLIFENGDMLRSDYTCENTEAECG